MLGEDPLSQETESQELQDQEMQEEEGFVDPTPRRAVRGANFTVKEDELLCRAWQTITLDAITGVEQQSNTYWERIHDHHKDNNKGGLYRSRVSLSHRWQTIQADCQKWAACLAQVERLNPSGTNEVDKVNGSSCGNFMKHHVVHIAQELYKGKPKKKGGKQGKSFGLHHCWALLQHDEKWRNWGANEIPNKKKANSSVGETVQVDIDDENSSGEDERSPTPSSVPRKRPDGRKKEKDKLKKGEDNVYKESLDNMLNIRKDIATQKKDLKTKELEEKMIAEERRVAAEERRNEIEEGKAKIDARRNEIEEEKAKIDARRAAAEERRAEAKERKVASDDMMKRLEQEHKIMFMDTSGLDPKAKAYHELLSDQILVSRTMGGFIGSMGGNGGFSGMGGNGAI
ncbi:hypothetical protein BRADI_3g14211v3 [Brachypodium distachyon]|uniref:No apical meristem-associated C-terminal domain-containing protein n=1 Tax=Brachypodium distachyon TaxID=15368 RepID=A0A2K2CX20_BRADI|nr:hypothetical protein BRADI_3g14211v3 [Brachypodium distachyon]